MFAMPMKAISERVRRVSQRTHNMPEEMRKAEIEAELERNWKEAMSKAENYVQGAHILERGGHFSALSLGNWEVLCEAAGVELIPSRLAGVINPVMILDVAMNGIKDHWMAEMQKFLGGLQDIADDEILRFDTSAAGALKQAMTLGRADGAVPAWQGWHRNENGVVFPEFQDDRLIEQMMENPENHAPVWIRKWIEPVMMEGDARTGYQAAMMPEHRLEEGQELPEGAGNLFPCEWRVFVKNGEVVAVGNYYTQIARGTTPEDEEIALKMAGQARAAAETLIARIREANAIPHHPKYEMRDGFDPDGIHFSLDFIEARDDEAPMGRRLVMIEGGPAHLRNPNWGAHPVSFGVKKEPEGLALSITDIRPLSTIDAD